MPTPAIHQLGSSFDDRNACLNVALGMISFLRRFKVVLREYGSLRPGPNDTTDLPPAPDGDSFLDATLGLISFSASMMGHLESTETEASGLRTTIRSQEPSDETDMRVVLRELLR